MSEAILELFGVVSPWLLLLLIPLYFWSRLVHKSLNSKDTHPESFERTVGWLRENSFGQLYLQFLGWLLTKVDFFIGENHRNTKNISLTDFLKASLSVELYLLSFKWAFFYPFFIYLLFVVLGSNDRLAGVDWLERVNEKNSHLISLLNNYPLISLVFLLVAVYIFYRLFRQASSESKYNKLIEHNVRLVSILFIIFPFLSPSLVSSILAISVFFVLIVVGDYLLVFSLVLFAILYPVLSVHVSVHADL